MVPSCSLILRPRLKDFLKTCFVQFIVYTWFTTQHHNINKYFDQIKHETRIFLILQGFSDKNLARNMIIFLWLILKSPLFIKNLMFSFQIFLTHMLRTLCSQMICHINLCLMIPVVPSFQSHFTNLLLMEITCSPLCFLTWCCWPPFNLMFKVM